MIRVARLNEALRVAVLDLAVRDGQNAFVSAPRERLADIEHDPQAEAYAVLWNDEVVGFYHLDFHPFAVAERAFPAPSCGLRNFLIDGRHQGHGYGRGALRALVRDLRDRHPQVRSLNLSVNCRNVAARHLYLAVGFLDAGELYRGGRSGPQHVMTLPLHEAR